jgi:hypothetical protein
MGIARYPSRKLNQRNPYPKRYCPLDKTQVRRGMVRVIRMAAAGALLLCGFGFALAGCGDSSNDEPSAAQLKSARQEGERAGRERARVDELEEEVRGLKRSARTDSAGEKRRAVSSTPPPAADGGTELLRSFHAPSGNVSCAITSGGAYCSVASIATTFRLRVGSPGEIESGAALPENFGEPIEFGSTVSAGSVTCTVPESDEPSGIICSDNTGHGFEASRVSERQKVY